MQVTLAALGGGTPETMTAGCTAALEQAGCVIGARRLLEQLPRGCTENRIAAINPEAILDEILRQNTDCAVVYSGDT